MTTPLWIELDGVVNMRDVGGLPTTDGGQVATGRLLRSDNLQDLTEADIDDLVERVGVTDIVDLRSNVELQLEGPGPLRARNLTHHHHSLFRDDVARGHRRGGARAPLVEGGPGGRRRRAAPRRRLLGQPLPRLPRATDPTR